MALFDNQTTSSVADLIAKLNTFLTTGGGGNPAWTADRHVPGSGEWAISKAALGTNTADIPVVIVTMPFAISSVPPVDFRALPIGIMEPSNTMTGHSMESYTSRIGTMFRPTYMATTQPRAIGR